MSPGASSAHAARAGPSKAPPRRTTRQQSHATSPPGNAFTSEQNPHGDSRSVVGGPAAGTSTSRRRVQQHAQGDAFMTPPNGAAPPHAAGIRPSGDLDASQIRSRRGADQSASLSGWTANDAGRDGPGMSTLDPFRRISPKAMVAPTAAAAAAAAGPSRPASHFARLNAQTNADGSLSAAGDSDEADGSGLLGLSPAIHLKFAPKRTVARARHVRDLGGAGEPGSPEREWEASSFADRLRGDKNTMLGTTSAADDAGMRSAELSAEGSIVIHSEPALAAEEHPFSAGLADVQEEDDVDAEGVLSGDRLEMMLHRMRRWRHDAASHFLFDTAIFWGDKILQLEPGPTAWNDAFHLATYYFLSHRYAQAEHLLMSPLRNARSRPREQQLPPAERPAPRDTTASDPLGEAVRATRTSSRLPKHLLSSARNTSSSAGAGFPEWNVRPENAASGVEGEMYEGEDDVLDGKKRKERAFTVSGTGTGSESDDAAGAALRNRQQDGKTSAAQASNHGLATPYDRHRSADVEEALDDAEDVSPPDGPTLAKESAQCRWLAAQCMARQAKYHEALDVLSGWKDDALDKDEKYGFKAPSVDGCIKLSSSKWHLRGQILMRLDDKDQAKTSFMRALSLDVRNFDAFCALVDGNLLGAQEQWDFVKSLEFVAQAGGDEANLEAHEMVRLLYYTRLDKAGRLHAKDAALARKRLLSSYPLHNNADILFSLAESLFVRMRFQDCHTVTKRILDISRDHQATLPLHISCFFQLPHLRPTLFLLAHHLSDTDPTLPAAWYAVGMWYACASRWLEARRFFSKSVHLDARFAYGWIAFAHTFALEGESDQAVTSYSTAARHFPSSHLPKLFIGMEHLHQGNLTLAKLFLDASAKLWQEDPLLCNELGVVAFHESRFGDAVEHFSRALQLSDQAQQPAREWAATHLNLALAHHRLDNDTLAIKSFRRVLQLEPLNAEAFIGLGISAHRTGQISSAIGHYHSALSIEPRNVHATHLLDLALQENALADPLGSAGGALSELLAQELHLRHSLDDRLEREEAPDEVDDFAASNHDALPRGSTSSQSQREAQNALNIADAQDSVSMEVDTSDA